MAPPAPGRFTAITLAPSGFTMPWARTRAVTSADVPAGKSTVISTFPRFGNGTSCAIAAAVYAEAAATTVLLRIELRFIEVLLDCCLRCYRSQVTRHQSRLQNLRHRHAPSFFRRLDPG